MKLLDKAMKNLDRGHIQILLDLHTIKTATIKL